MKTRATVLSPLDIYLLNPIAPPPARRKRKGLFDLSRNDDFEGAFLELLRLSGVKELSRFELKTSIDPCRDLKPDQRRSLLSNRTERRQIMKTLRAARPAKPQRAAYEILRALIEFRFLRFSAALEACRKSLQFDPDWAWAHLWRARVSAFLLIKKRKSKLTHPVGPLLPEMRTVLEAFAAVERLAPDNKEVYAYRADFLISMDQEARALSDLDRLLDLDPAYSWAYVIRADALSEFHRNEEALRDIESLCRIVPDSAWACAFRGRELGKAGRYKASYRDLTRALRLDSSLAEVNAWIGESLRKQGDYAAALPWVERALRVNPENYNALIWKARLLLAMGRARDTLDLFRRAKRGGDYPDEHFYLLRGEALLKCGCFAAAALDFDRAFPSSPTTIWSPKLLRGKREPGGGDSTALFDDLDRLNARGTPSAWLKGFRGWLIAERQDRGASQEESAGLLDEAVRRAPRNPWLRCWRARVRLRQGRSHQAREDMNLTLTLKKNYAPFWAWSGVVHMELKDYARAEYDLSRALKIGPGLGGYYAYRGRLRHQAGRPEEALSDLDEALLRGPAAAEWHLWRGEVKRMFHRTEEAQEDFDHWRMKQEAPHPLKIEAGSAR